MLLSDFIDTSLGRHKDASGVAVVIIPVNSAVMEVSNQYHGPVSMYACLSSTSHFDKVSYLLSDLQSTLICAKNDDDVGEPEEKKNRRRISVLRTAVVS